MGELRELVELREDAAALARDEARARFRDAAGMQAESTVQERLRAHPQAASRDALAQICEHLEEGVSDEPEKIGRATRLAGLRELLVRARARSLEPGAFQELLAGELRPSVEMHGDAGLHGLQPIRSIERQLGRERNRGERADMEAALASAVGQLDGARAAAWEAAQSALGELEAGEPVDAAARLHARGWGQTAEKKPPGPAEIASACERLLLATEPVARDLGAWLLERHSGARPFPGDAERHDLLHLLRAPRCAPAFPRGEMLRSCRRWAEGWKLDLEHQRAIRLDEEARPLAREGACAEPIDPPEEVRVQLFAEEGPWALGQLLSALGAAQLLAGPPGDAPPEDLLCPDPALPIASGELFAGLLRDDSFRRRCAKAELPVDDARALSVAHLFTARIAAAQTLASLEALRGSLSARAGHQHRELYARASLTALPSGLALRELDPFLAPWARLRALAFAARTRAFLRDRFDEDWWRNPRAQRPLQSLWGRGGRSNLPELWSELAPEETPSIEPLLRELAELCS